MQYAHAVEVCTRSQALIVLACFIYNRKLVQHHSLNLANKRSVRMHLRYGGKYEGARRGRHSLSLRISIISLIICVARLYGLIAILDGTRKGRRAPCLSNNLTILG